jgi:hypothetical protein
MTDIFYPVVEFRFRLHLVPAVTLLEFAVLDLPVSSCGSETSFRTSPLA